MSNSAFQPTVLTVPSGTTGSGQGELNLITNPVAASNLDGWFTGSVGRGTSGGPLNPSIGTYFTVAAANSGAGNTESSTTGAYSVLSLPSGLQNKKLKVEFYFTSFTDVYYVSVYKGTTRVPLTTDVSGSTSLPTSTTGKFVAYFDTDSSGTWSVNITRKTGTGSALQFTNVVVGPGIQPQGAVVGEWQISTTPTVGGLGSKGLSSSSFRYRRVGSNMELYFQFIGNNTASGTGTTDITFTIPDGYTRNTTIAIAGDTTSFGAVQTWGVTSSGVYDYATVAIPGATNNTVRFLKPNANATYVTSDLNVARSIQFEGFLTIPIAEWAGSGTVQLAQNDVEYASNGKSDNTASDTATFVYGPGGSLVPNGATGTSYVRGVKFQSPVQATDRLFVEVNDGSGWAPIETRLGGFSTQNATSYGVRLQAVGGDATRYNVTFMSGGYESGGSASYGVNGSPWSGISTYMWRVRKSSAGAAVGFGIVAPGVSSGLVSASGLPGNTTGNAIASGYVGEVITATLSNVSIAVSNTAYNAGLLSLPAGTWLVFGKVMWSASSGSNATFARVGISTTSATEDALSSTMLTNTTTNDVRIASNPKVVSTTGQTIYLVFRAGFTGTATSTDATQSTFYAVRIA